MSYNFSELQTIYPNQLWLELSNQAQEDAWKQIYSQHYSNDAARWRAFLNYLSLNTLSNWLKDDPEFSNVIKIPSLDDLATYWEVVNGCAITVDNTKLVLIPSDKSNPLEFEVSAEWVNIPDWAGEYYLHVQLNLEQSWLRVWGYTTHEQLTQYATFNQMTRTYCLERESLIEDLNVMWVAREYCQQQLHFKPLLTTSNAQATQLLNILSQSNIHSPRLYGNFDEWSALIASNTQRQELYKARLSKLSNTIQPRFTNLTLWLEDIFETGWQHVDALLNLQQRTLAAQFRQDTALTPHRTQGAKLIDLGMQLGNKAVVLLIGLSPEIDDKVNIRVQLYPTSGEYYLPASIKLSLLLPSGAVVQEVVSRNHDNYIQLKRFKFPLGKSFSIQLVLQDVIIKEDFMLDALIGKSP
ncbi:hypothetical protein DSM106972_057640 [Dulcicalothrix desertica PCC 7102]|uniref:DUF1822 domain-containing protein n=1 Tax=Dulcicalothrix desertica PCC 7102 TaxID=232991 RepID=A0A3S1AK63_9CYAN|nr:DUF1822 family protein [Dulcicalothrix desertica]RUT02844.1 hypothetical protein DSM106972_057640 [Dulcicalothrix desertica PCC 7102]TWH38923.1 uncharacterized protein DUF1822 [Dulcicalothrix desertica PCC 7102]